MIRLFLGKTNFDGEFSVHLFDSYVTVKPFKLPVKSLKKHIEQYTANKDLSYLAYDSNLGWVTRPLSTSKNGLYSCNEDGVRKQSINEPTVSARDNLKIVILGDSYTHCDEVSYENSWGYFLEEKLAQVGIQCDVINLGVPGYGMDQAYLRWELMGKKLKPDFVIFGFQPENLKRNINICRKLYHKPGGIPFTKSPFYPFKW